MNFLIEKELQKIAYNRKIFLGLDQITKSLDRLGNPQENLKFIHVAGTNGKGTTSDYIARLLEDQGYRVGLYTSPHLLNYNERFKINNTNISDKKLNYYFQKTQKMCSDLELTEFELLTAMAALYFYEEKVDYLVWETGMGGRLDATNVITPIISVITSISLDHQQFLGDSVIEIAKEKAGIIKPEIPVVSLDQSNDILAVLQNTASKNKSLLSIVPRQDNLYLTENFNLAKKTVSLISKISEDQLPIYKETRLYGRMQQICSNPQVILDSAHNLEGINSLLTYLRNSKEQHEIIYGAIQRPDLVEIIKSLQEYSPKIICCEFDSFKSVSVQHYRKFINDNNATKIISKDNLKQFLKKIFKNKGSRYCLVGSIYFLGAAIPIYQSAQHE